MNDDNACVVNYYFDNVIKFKLNNEIKLNWKFNDWPSNRSGLILKTRSINLIKLS